MTSNAFTPGAASAPSTLVEISVSCRNLKDSDTFSKSDPMCVLFIKEPCGKSHYEFGRTETIQDNLNPDFVHKFVLQYHFEEMQSLRFEIYDIDSLSANLGDHDFLGRVDCTLGEIVAYQGTQFRRNLIYELTCQMFSPFNCWNWNPIMDGNSSEAPSQNGKSGINKGKYGYILIVAEEVKSCKTVMTMQFAGSHLDKKDFFGKSDPFLVFSKQNEDNSFSVVHKTEVIKCTLDPTWKPFIISVQALNNGVYKRPIKVECFDWNSSGTNDFIGGFITDFETLSDGPGPLNEYECINSKKRSKKKNYKNSGVVKLLSVRVEEQPTFLDYIQRGTQIHCTVAVDFTASNGDPRDPRSLHFIKSETPNPYALAIRAIGEIIQDYDSDKLFPALGFGARLPPDGRVSHEFFLNGDAANPYCFGVEGILEAYYRSLHSVQLYGPTNFAPVINHVANFARTCEVGSHYFILLIITDGIITDMPQTKEAIVLSASLPMSIIIIGVGSADFSAMEVLDGDIVRISSKGRYAERDIVQFVPFRNFLSRGNWVKDKAALAREVLAEIPDQFLGYMKLHGIKPKEPKIGESQDNSNSPHGLASTTELEASPPFAPSAPQMFAGLSSCKTNAPPM